MPWTEIQDREYLRIEHDCSMRINFTTRTVRILWFDGDSIDLEWVPGGLTIDHVRRREERRQKARDHEQRHAGYLLPLQRGEQDDGRAA